MTRVTGLQAALLPVPAHSAPRLGLVVQLTLLHREDAEQRLVVGQGDRPALAVHRHEQRHAEVQHLQHKLLNQVYTHNISLTFISMWGPARYMR